MESSHTSIEINAISADGLTVDGKCRVKRAFFVTVRTGSRFHEAADTDIVDGRGCASWNQQLKLSLPPLAPSISLEVRRARSTSGSKLVAAVTVPLSDFACFWPDGHLHHLSYRLRDAQGKPNGIINFSLRLFGVAARYQRPRPTFAPVICHSGLSLAGKGWTPTPYRTAPEVERVKFMTRTWIMN